MVRVVWPLFVVGASRGSLTLIPISWQKCPFGSLAARGRPSCVAGTGGVTVPLSNPLWGLVQATGSQCLLAHLPRPAPTIRKETEETGGFPSVLL